ncbi:MAG: hypothetical protein M3179_03505 [Actinomycetota bacterium]|nr:hypothetical protein [Actinomycetota bacterium]
MARPRVYSDELRERAVRLLWEWREARGVTEGGYRAISEQLGLQRETLRFLRRRPRSRCRRTH